MNKNTERQFQQTDAAVEQTAAAIMREIKQLLRQQGGESVAAAELIERLLLTLLEKHDFAELVDHLAKQRGPAALKLANALADYRGSLPTER
jgi:hypothetical protein